ncbi:ABC transporter permease [Paramicrobacterium chengjingii]|uniref:ABC transporter permease n=1 Tax=Paramicrobacterium chengjingii TaxID=2769067 RepID=UPI001F3EFFF0|nr:ABC transporter permease [Microbacterium chengjingii]
MSENSTVVSSSTVELDTTQLSVQPAPRKRRRMSLWGGYALRRFGGLLLSLSLLIVVTFFIVPLIPGDPAVAVAGADATREQRDAIREQLGLNDPLSLQFVHYITGIFTGQLGDSFAYGEPVMNIILTKMPFTLELALFGILITLAISVPLGMIVGVATQGGRRRWLDVVFGMLTGLFQSIPQFVTATFLVVIFAITLRLLPAAGATSLSSLILPLVALSLGPICSIARVVRRETATVLEQDYIRTAKGNRLGSLRLYARHALPNLLTTTLTLSGLILAGMLGGAIIIETVFSWPGLGREVVTAIAYKDYPVIQGVILVLGLIAILINLLIDVILGVIDPRTLGGTHANG